jgi:hypothetical protein
MILPMKVAPDLSGVAALDTWLRAADTGQALSANSPAAGANLFPTTLSASSAPRDPAEDLLVLDVRGTTASDVDHPGAGASAQDWADHIFSPLR